MKTVKFKSKENIQFGQALRKKVSAYFQENGISDKGNWTMGLKALVVLGMYIAPFVVIVTVTLPFWFMLILSVIMGIGLASTGMALMHDGSHNSISSSPWLNKLAAGTMYILGGNAFNWKVQHTFLHHTYTNIEGMDEDIQATPILRLSTHGPKMGIHRFQHIYAPILYSLMTFSKIVNDFSQLWGYNKKGLTEKQNKKPFSEYIVLALTKVAYLAVVIGLPLIFSSFAWWQLLIGFLLMHMVGGFIMSTIFQLAHVVEGAEQHEHDLDNTVHNEWAIHQVVTTADFAPKNKILGYFIGGLNFQIEHHLFPNICHIHYPKIAPIVEETAKEFGINYNRNQTLMGALVSHFRQLKALGKNEKPELSMN